MIGSCCRWRRTFGFNSRAAGSAGFFALVVLGGGSAGLADYGGISIFSFRFQCNQRLKNKQQKQENIRTII